jgi:hypothetical protein
LPSHLQDSIHRGLSGNRVDGQPGFFLDGPSFHLAGGQTERTWPLMYSQLSINKPAE